MTNHKKQELLESLYRVLDNWDDNRFVLRQLRAIRSLNDHTDLLREREVYLRLYKRFRRRRTASDTPESAGQAFLRYKRTHQLSWNDSELDAFRRNISRIIYWIHCGYLGHAKHCIRIIIRHNLRNPDILLYKVCEKLFGFDGAMVVRKYHPDVMLWLNRRTQQ